MSEGLVHSPNCLVGTSHRIPGDCKDVEFKPIWYPAVESEPEVTAEPTDNSEEGRKAVEAAAQADQDIMDALDAHLARLDRNPDPDGHADIIPGVEGNPAS